MLWMLHTFLIQNGRVVEGREEKEEEDYGEGIVDGGHCGGDRENLIHLPSKTSWSRAYTDIRNAIDSSANYRRNEAIRM